MQKKALTLALDKLGQGASTLDWLFAGDLLNQCIGSSFAAREQHLPFFGLYGACSTMGEGLILASMALDGDFGRRAGCWRPPTSALRSGSTAPLWSTAASALPPPSGR